MRGSSIIFKYFPGLSEKQKNQFASLYDLYAGWNEKINLISRKDFEFFYERHVLHSLAIAKVIQFKNGAEVMDVGTGGGLPGIPLAIFFPETKFTLVDSIGKKIKVVNNVAYSINLTNVDAFHSRAEELNGTFDFIVSRATATLEELLKWTKGKYKKTNRHTLPNGLICLKGGDLKGEVEEHKNDTEVFDIKDYFSEEFFETKKIVFVTSQDFNKIF
jgi:16S rRNA (guanine527-N7)-methyltransferase